MANEFTQKRVSQSDYRGGKTRAKKSPETLNTELPQIKADASVKKKLVTKITDLTHHLFDTLLGEEKFSEERAKFLSYITRKLHLK